jgi:molecular chaperone DnaJ
VIDSASEDEIKKAYYKLALLYHPDKATGNATKFKAVASAYEIIGSEEKRMHYDKDRESSGNKVK